MRVNNSFYPVLLESMDHKPIALYFASDNVFRAEHWKKCIFWPRNCWIPDWNWVLRNAIYCCIPSHVLCTKYFSSNTWLAKHFYIHLVTELFYCSESISENELGLCQYSLTISCQISMSKVKSQQSKLKCQKFNFKCQVSKSQKVKCWI